MADGGEKNEEQKEDVLASFLFLFCVLSFLIVLSVV
jgi:hypothetical protein